MNLNRVDIANTDEVFLDVSKLVDSLVYERVALVVSADAGLTRSNDGFARFFLKDVNANVVCARLFNVQDFIFSGIKLSQFKNKPVKLKFVAQAFNGRPSLVIDGSYGVKEYTGDFDRARFIGEYKFDEESITKAALGCGLEQWKFPRMWGVASFAELGGGKVGAFAKVIELCIAKISSIKGLDGIDSEELMQVFFAVAECYFRLLKTKEQCGYLSDLKSFDVLSSINQMDFDKGIRAVVLDCMRPLGGFGKATHLYSLLINDAIVDSKRVLDMVQINSQLAIGSSTRIEGGVLLSRF